jgi:predicted GNAT family N-acyltransferase
LSEDQSTEPLSGELYAKSFLQTQEHPAGFAGYVALGGMSTVVARPPAEFTPQQIDDFVAFVLAGGEVTADGLRKRVSGAQCIAFLHKEQCLVGVAALKQPQASYRTRVEMGSKFAVPSKAFPLELGWVFILPSARGEKLSSPLCQSVVAAAGTAGVFATSRVGNDAMHKTLGKLGFVRVGSEWRSKQTEDKLALFVKNAA